jgi:uncharacterized GH25 family protein
LRFRLSIRFTGPANRRSLFFMPITPGFLYIVLMKKLVLVIFISALSAIVFAHEFWLQPQKFFYTIREVANIRFNVGENFTGQNWTGNKDKIDQLLLFSPSGSITDISSRVSQNSGDSVQVPLQQEGTHMVIFNSTNSFIELEAEKFNDYLLEDGLDQTIAYRKKNGESQLSGKENYQRSVKTIFQVGGKLTDDCITPTSLPLDILPEENPYSIPLMSSRSGPLKVKFKVLFQGLPLNNALVKIWYHSADKKIRMDSLRTNKRGWVTANRHPGPYMVSCVYMERQPVSAVAHWQSYWGSLSFEYSQFFGKASSKQ